MAIKPARRIAGRITAVLVLVVLCLGAATGTASASAPTITRSGPFVLDSIETSCGFDVAVHATGTQSLFEWTDAAGNSRLFLFLPTTRVVATNVQTGKTVTHSTSGPEKVTFFSDGSARFMATGVTLLNMSPEITGGPGLFLIKGRVVQVLDSQGNVTVSRTGTLVDLCAELAA